MAREEKKPSYYFRPHVLVVDDDTRICELLSRYLLDQGMIVFSANSADHAQDLIQQQDFDLYIFDIMMPKSTGLELAEILRQQGNDVPIVFLTALGETENKVSGFDAGGDDYIVKPFEPQELLLRLRAILKRTLNVQDEVKDIYFGDMVLNLSQGVLYRGDNQRVMLTDSERELLLVMAQRVGSVMSREELAAQCDVQSVRAVDVQVTRLRKKIEPDVKAPQFIQTIRGQGYVLRARQAS